MTSPTVNVTKWTWASQIYMVFTSYKYLRGGHERCQEGKEFDCSPPSFLSSSQDHMCMSSNLACDGLPNCGQVRYTNIVLPTNKHFVFLCEELEEVRENNKLCM